MQDAADPLQPLGRDGGGDILEWQVSGHQGYTQPAGGQHHHHLAGGREFGKELGVPREGDAGFVDHALVHGSGDHPGEVSVQATLAGAGQGFQHVVRVQRFQGAGPGRRIQGCIPDVEAAGRGRGIRQAGWLDIDQLDGQAQFAGALLEQAAAGDGDQGMGLGRSGKEQAEVGADAGGFTWGEGEAERFHSGSLLGVQRVGGDCTASAPDWTWRLTAWFRRRLRRGSGAARPAVPRRTCGCAARSVPAARGVCRCCRWRGDPALPAHASHRGS
ncbi:hypothetical protein D9M69_447000 [compost metagenome]